MSNYTTQTSALKATTIDTKFLDAKRIDTQKLCINGKEFTWKDNLKHLYYIIEVTQNSSGNFVVSSAQISDLLTNEKTDIRAVIGQGSKMNLPAIGSNIDIFEDGWWLMLPKTETSTISQICINHGLPRKVLLPVLEQPTTSMIKIAEETDTITELYNKTDTIRFDIVFDRFA